MLRRNEDPVIVVTGHNRNYDKYGRWEVKLGMSGVWEETQGV